jgi:hypothetical protein
MRLERFARAGLPLQIEFFVDLFGAEVLEDGAPCGDRSERVRDSWCNREQRVRYVTSERSTASSRSVLAQSPGGEAAWAHCPAEAVRTPLVWLRRADASDESARTQRDFDRDDSEPAGVQGMPQMARSIGTPGCHPPAKHIGVQHINEYHWISVISSLVVCSTVGVILLSVWRFDRRVRGHRYCRACGVDVHGLGRVSEQICQRCRVDLFDEIVAGLRFWRR